MIKIPGIIALLTEIAEKYPRSSPRNIARLAFNLLDKKGPISFSEKEFYLRYRRTIYTVKWRVNRARKAELLGQVLKPLSHRMEYYLSKPIPGPILDRLKFWADKRKPSRKDPKPRGRWYRIPNRNRGLGYRDDKISVQIFPKSGKARILPAEPVSYPLAVHYFEGSLLFGGLGLEAREISRLMIPRDRHRTFLIGPVEPFKIDYYRDSLGIDLLADGSHPNELEIRETWPSWVGPTIQIQRENTAAIREFSQELRSHLKVMRGIGEATDRLSQVLGALERLLRDRSTDS